LNQSGDGNDGSDASEGGYWQQYVFPSPTLPEMKFRNFETFGAFQTFTGSWDPGILFLSQYSLRVQNLRAVVKFQSNIEVWFTDSGGNFHTPAPSVNGAVKLQCLQFTHSLTGTLRSVSRKDLLNLIFDRIIWSFTMWKLPPAVFQPRIGLAVAPHFWPQNPGWKPVAFKNKRHGIPIPLHPFSEPIARPLPLRSLAPL
jgi:hypothetical protein